MKQALRAELFLLRRNRAMVLVGVGWILMSIAFGLVIPLIVHEVIGSKPTASVPDPAQLVDGLRPVNIMATTTGLYPIYGAALMVVLGALAVGSDFRHRTWQTLFVQDSRRRTVVAAKLVAASVAGLVIAAADVVAMAVASLVIAAAIGLPLALPGAGEILGGLAAICLTSTMAVCLGAVLAALFRGVALVVGVGLVWMLAVENLMSSLAGVSPVFERVRAALPGGSAGSLMSAFSGTTDKLPGVAHVEPQGVAVAVIAAYLAVSVVLAIELMRRRDVV